ncbi:MAG: hypothetical protein GTO24_23660 [candidate division Zixibacteria bacterium]|nr:hypothetical protein [candidate division Zixibacteria bacterium]
MITKPRSINSLGEHKKKGEAERIDSSEFCEAVIRLLSTIDSIIFQ